MGFIKSVIERCKEKIRLQNDVCNRLIGQLNIAIQEINAAFRDQQSFVEPRRATEWKAANAELIEKAAVSNIRKLKKAAAYQELKKTQAEFHHCVDTLNARIEEHNERIRQNELCNQLIGQIDAATQEADSIFQDQRSYIKPEREAAWRDQYADLFERVSNDNIQKLTKADFFQELKSKQTELCNHSNALSRRISEHNEKVIQNAYGLIGDVEGRTLDRQQMICIIKDAHNHLVIAGAGTGKTTTVVGKIKFLLKSGKYNPEDLLVLSFTNASASEMSERIHEETGCNIAASTFHKLGLNIITKVGGVVPKITQLSLRKFIRDQLQVNMRSDAYMNLLSSYLLHNRVIAKSEFEFETQAEYEEYLKLNPPVTVAKEAVKSYGEMEIANFLMQNGIPYIYEEPYKIDTRTSEYGQYHPDFYLPDYDIYIEYFGVDRDGEVPSYFRDSHGKTATQIYRESMEWKRETHRKNATTLIECFAYEKLEGTLLDNLQKSLAEKSVEFKPKTTKELWEQLSAEGEKILDGIIELFETVINLIKSNGYSIGDVRQLNAGNRNMKENDALLSLIEPIFNAYRAYLIRNNEIDFNDMINTAKQYVDEGKYRNPYKYVIVDEYQDISKARFLLLESLRKSGNYDLFCVGDDWQSIYRFAGSDIGYILNFEKYWGPTETSKIEMTYRFSQKLIEISGAFIMQNPKQIRKSIIGKTADTRFALGEINGYTDKYAVGFMSKRLGDLPKNSSVFFIGRYSFDVRLLSDSGLFECQYNNVSGFEDVSYRRRPDLKMNFITAHKSKGLQADYVFIINNKKSRMGFPSKIQDAPILTLLLDNCDSYPHAEERRLFYVALTRAKRKVFLVTVKDQESCFALELRNRYSDDLKREQFECPLCGGRLLKKSGPYGEFFGCSNYKTAGCRYKRKIVSAGSPAQTE